MTGTKNDSHGLLEASGSMLIVPATWTHNSTQEIPERWTEGPITLCANLAELGTSISYFNNPAGIVDAGERRAAFTPRTAEMLLGNSTVAPDEQGSRRIHFQFESPVAIVEGIVATAVEVIYAPQFAPQPSNVGQRAVVLLHLNRFDERTESSEVTRKLHEWIRIDRKRAGLLTKLNHICGDVVNVKGSLPSAEGIDLVPPVYCVLTAPTLNAANDQDLLKIRELATITPSVVHGTTDTARRLERARLEVVRLSDQWGFMCTGHATLFFGLAPEPFGAARVYSTTIYAEVIALQILRREILNEVSTIGWKTSMDLGVLDEGPARGYRPLEVSLSLKKCHLLVRSSAVAPISRESRNVQAVSRAMEGALETALVDQELQQILDGLVGLATIERDIIEQKAEARRAEDAQLAADRASRIELLLTLLATIALPLTAVYTFIDFVNSESRLLDAYWIATALAAVLGGIVLIWGLWRRPKRFFSGLMGKLKEKGAARVGR